MKTGQHIVLIQTKKEPEYIEVKFQCNTEGNITWHSDISNCTNYPSRNHSCAPYGVVNEVTQKNLTHFGSIKFEQQKEYFKYLKKQNVLVSIACERSEQNLCDLTPSTRTVMVVLPSVHKIFLFVVSNSFR